MSILILTAVFIAVTYFYGLLYAIIGNANRRCLISAFKWTGFSIIAAVGVIFHELTHFITALLFRHNVTEIALYRPIKGRYDGCLGYVHHEYNQASLYQKIGNFFIGCSPMITGAALMSFLLKQALPEHSFVISDVTINGIFTYICSIAIDFRNCLCERNIFAVLLTITAVAICPHISMSFADFKNSIYGIMALFIASVTLPCIIINNFGVTYAFLSAILFDFFVVYVYALSMGLLVSIVVLIVNKIIDIII